MSDLNSFLFYHPSKPPCKDCDDRELGCHSKCITYNSWKEKDMNFKRKIYNERRINNALCGLQIEKFAKIRGKKLCTKSW